MAKDANDKVTSELIAKPGRPSTGKALTPAQRQRARRSKLKFSDPSEIMPVKTVSVMLSSEAYASLRMLTKDRGLTQKSVIESLLNSAAVDLYVALALKK